MLSNIILKILHLLPQIFYKLVYMSIIASILFVIIYIIDKLVKQKISPKIKNLIWTVFFASLIIPINITSNLSIIPKNIVNIQDISYRNEYYKAKETYEEVYENEKYYEYYEIDKKIEEKTNNLNTAKTKYIIFDYIIPILYFAILFILIYIYICSYIKFRIKISKNYCKDERLNKILDKCKEYLDIKKEVKLIKQDFVLTPSIFGIINPKILISDNIYSLSDTQIRDIFLHELAHFKRKDTAFNPICTILKSVYFFNPIIILAFRYFKKDIEIATDENVAINLYDDEKKEYCKTLLELSYDKDNLSVSKVLSISSGYSKSVLKERITLVKLADKLQNNKILHTVIIIILLIIISICLLTVKPKTDVQINNEFSEIPKDTVTLEYPKIYVKQKVLVTDNTTSQLSIIANNLLRTYFNNFFKDNTEPNQKISNFAPLSGDVLAGDLDEFVIKVKYKIRSEYPKSFGISYWGVQGADNMIENEVMLRVRRLSEFEYETDIRKYAEYEIVEIDNELKYDDLEKIEQEFVDYSVF